MRILLGLLAIAGLAVLTALAVQRGTADLLAFGARHGLERAGFSTGESRQRAYRGLEQAIRLDGGNPEHREYLGRWYEAAARYREALAHYRAAVQARPAWPYGWADVARIKLRLRQFDAELDEAVKNASRFGPWEPPVQLGIAALAMEAGHRLTPEARGAALALMSNALKRQERELVELAYRRGRLDLLCSIPRIAEYPAARRCI